MKLFSFPFRVILLVWLSASIHAGAVEPGIAVIMASGNTPVKLTKDDVAMIFKSKKRFWPDGQRIQPVNFPAQHPLRRAFSAQVFKQSPEELEDYWRDMYFHGILPPYVLLSEEAVIRFIAGTPGAIGYLPHCVADQRIVVVLYLDNGTDCQH